jgi:VanZ family protein
VRRFLFWILVAAYCGVIFYLSSLSHPLPQLTLHVWDKALHLAEYSGLGALLALALGVWDEPRKAWRVGLAVVLGCLYGISDETHQLFVVGRDAEIGDALADAIGTAVGAVTIWLVAAGAASGKPSRIDAGSQENSG